MPYEAQASRSRDRIRAAAYSWRSWSSPAFYRVYDMVRQTIVEIVREMESRRLSVHHIIVGNIVLELLREANRRWHLLDPMGGNQVAVGVFYGVHLVSDQLMDHETMNGDVRSDMRFLTDRPVAGQAPIVGALEIRNNPVTLSYNFIVEGAGHAHDLVVSCAEMVGEGRPRPQSIREHMAQELEQNANSMVAEAARLRGLLLNDLGLNDPRPVPVPGVREDTVERKSPEIKRWTELSVAWES